MNEITNTLHPSNPVNPIPLSNIRSHYGHTSQMPTAVPETDDNRGYKKEMNADVKREKLALIVAKTKKDSTGEEVTQMLLFIRR